MTSLRLALALSGLLLAWSPLADAELFISEVLLNPPGSDSTNEFIELRGTPNLTVPAGSYLVSVEGDAASNPGTIQNVFDLSGRRLGQNGFLLLLQKFHRYKPNPLATVVTNADADGGWGSGSSSSVRHRGENGQTELENPSCTLFLIQSDTAPNIGNDIDVDDDGHPDGVFTNWTVLDSVGVLDNDGAGDFAYGQINFRRATLPGAGAGALTGTVVPISFTPSYVARNGNTKDWAATNWVASDNLLGVAPNWFLGSVSAAATNTFPVQRAKAPLNHLGAPNFKAPILPGVLIRETRTNTLVSEAGLRDSYTIGLSTRPTGAVTIRIEAPLPAQVSVDGGRTFGLAPTVVLTSKTARKVMVRALDDGAAGPPQRRIQITHTIVNTLDAASYPTNTIILPVAVTVLDTNVVLLSEVKVNPPGAEDAPFEYVELRGPPGKLLTNLWLLAVQGNASADPGTAEFVLDLTSHRLGTNGLLMVAAPGHPYAFSPATTIVLAPRLADSGGALDNGTFSLLLVGTSGSLTEGMDLDNGDNGTLEGLPADTFLLDAVGWSDGGDNDVIYGGVDLTQPTFTPDAASRLPKNSTPRSAAAWVVGDLAGFSGGSLIFDDHNMSTNLPVGSVLSPGVINRAGPRLVPNPMPPVSGVIGDPENATVNFTVSDPDSPAALIRVTATSTNPAVVPDSRLALTNLGGGTWRLSIDPIGVGFSQILITVSDGNYSTVGFLDYAASAPGRPGGKWHTGVSDASTAIAIDSNWMYVGDDENQVLRIFSRTHSGGPVAEHDFSPFLKLIDLYSNGTPKEVDIEASTRVGNRIFWLGSHSHAFDATERTNRARVFGTDLSGSGTNAQLKYLAHYNYLKVDLLNWDAQNGHGQGADYYGLVASGAVGMDPKSPDGSGFNLEGLCMAPGSTTNAYVAFRAPLVPPSGPNARANALIVPVRNFATLASKGGGPGTARFGDPIELNLGGRGIRSIEGAGTNYLIIAGPPGAGSDLPPPGNFRLFTWSGQRFDPPQERDTDLSGLNPEGIVEVPSGPWSATNLVQLVSDNGTKDYYGDGVEAKHLAVRQFKKFRVDLVPLGNITNAAPLLKAVEASAESITVSWFSREDLTYRLQMKSALGDSWTDVAGDVVATGAIARKTVPSPAGGQCFFRVVVVP